MPASVFETLKTLSPTISVGVLTADLMRLGEDLTLLDKTDVGILHFDVMDGCFCPMMTVGPPFIKGVNTDLIKDVHLMISQPLEKLGDYVAAGADIVTVHVESEPTHIHRVFQQLGKMENAKGPERGIVRGVALNPGTGVEAISPVLDVVEMVVLLGINPGWGGQKLVESTRKRVERVRELTVGTGILLAIDGGITKDNIAEVATMRPDMVVTGSAVFDGKTPVENVGFMLNELRSRA